MMDTVRHLDVGVARALFERSSSLVAVFDKADRLTFANRAFRRAYGLDSAESLTWSELVQRGHEEGPMNGIGAKVETDDFAGWLLSAASRRGQTPYRSIECPLWDDRWILMTEELLADGSMLCIGIDITAIRADERTIRIDRDHAQRDALTDPLTGSGNRRYVETRLSWMMEQALRNNAPLALAMFDIDRFKAINDRFGHSRGDDALRDFASRAGRLIRRGDAFGRFGGEEFVLIIGGAPGEEARAIAEAVLVEARRSGQDHADTPAYTVSAGFALLQPGDTGHTLVARADRALYRAKNDGRDRLIEDGGETPARELAIAG